MGRLDRMVELWAWQEGARLATFPAHCGFVSAVLLLHAQNQLLTAGEDGKVWLQGVMVGYLEGVAKAGIWVRVGPVLSLEEPGGRATGEESTVCTW